jgi:uncharacterized protein (UPF0276 family)
MTHRELGIGLTFHPELEGFLERHSELVDVLELEPQTLWLPRRVGGNAFAMAGGALERVAAFPQAKLVHSVGLPVGGSRLADLRQVPLLRETIARLGSPWCSEHLSFNVAAGSAGTFFTGFLLPPRLTWKGVERAVASVRRASEALGAPLAIETGVSYLRPRDDELSDAGFVAAVADAADCGVLLDIHNIWTNERNGRQTVDSYLDELPLKRVWEVHLAGGQEHAGFWLDAHSGAISAEVLAVAAEAVPRLPNLGAIIFELMPEHVARLGEDGLGEQIEALRRLWATRSSKPNALLAGASAPVIAERPSSPPDPQTWEDTLGAVAVGFDVGGELARELAADPGVAVVRELVGEARAGMVAASLRLTIRLLLLELGEAELRRLLGRFWATVPPQAFAADEGLAFGGYLQAAELTMPYLDDVLAFELAVLRASVADQVATVRFHADPDEVLGSLAAGRLPTAASDGDYALEVSGSA